MNFLSKNILQSIAIIAALLFVYANVLTKLVRDWWRDENYSFGLLIPFVIAYIILTEKERLRNAQGKPSLVSGVAMSLCALFFLWAGTAGAELFTQRMSLVLLLIGLTVYFWGWRLVRALMFPFVLLVLAIPIPTIVLNQVAFPLQLFASRCAVWSMQLFDIPVLRSGNVIELMPRTATQPLKLEVVAACSGIRSLMTLVSLAVVYAYFTHPSKPFDGGVEDGEAKDNDNKGTLSFFTDSIVEQIKTFRFWRAVLIVSAAVPIAILTNALRVSGTGVLAHYYGRQAAEGFFHAFSGWVVYIVAFLLLLLFGWMLDFVSSKFQVPSSKFQVPSSKFQVQSPRFSLDDNEQRTAYSVQRFWIVFVVLVLTGICVHWLEWGGEARVDRKPLAEFPAKVGDWKQFGGDQRFDKQAEEILRADDYVVRDYALPDGKTANLYIGYYATQKTGATYHSPQNCLPGSGWVMTEPSFVQIKTEDGHEFSANSYILQNEGRKFVMLYWYQGRGRAVASEYWDKVYTVFDSATRRRSDGAMVRVILQVGQNQEESVSDAVKLSGLIAPVLPTFIPN